MAALSLSLACVAPAVRPPRSDADPRDVLERFSAAVGEQRWDEAYPLLSARWRASESPSRLAADMAAAGTVARDAVQRVRALLGAGTSLTVTSRTATLPIAPDRAARLVREGGAWRVDALE
jgi:hypothetical protein